MGGMIFEMVEEAAECVVDDPMVIVWR